MAPTVPTRPLGKQGLQASAQGLGCMSLTKGFYAGSEGDLPPEADRIAVIQKALSSGVSLLDTADFYGAGAYENHIFIGKAIKGVPRDQVVLASKWGPTFDEKMKPGHDASPEAARKGVERALQNLGVDYIDLLILRSTGPTVPIEESVKGMAALVKEGLVKGIGLSEIGAADIRKAHAVHPITAIEAEWSLFSRDAERDLIPTCRELGIAFLAYSPMSRGMLTGKLNLADLPANDFRRSSPRFAEEAMKQNQKLVEKIKAIADRKGCTQGQLALSWVHHQGNDVFPIPGTKRVKYLEENIAAFDVKLSKEDLVEIEEAIPHDQVVGDRYAASGLTYHG